jgi:predicted alpha/beta hydrolase
LKWQPEVAASNLENEGVPPATRAIAAADYGLSRIQHMGFFRDGSEPLWREAIEWLETITVVNRP